MTIVIVGAGLAAATLVTELRAKGYRDALVVYGAENHPPYERPPLSKAILLGRAELTDALVHDGDWYHEHNVELRLGTRVSGLDPARRTLHADGPDGTSETGYDQVVLATGATPRRLELAERAGPVVYLRTIEDSLRLRAALGSGVRVGIVGAGWIGLEVAAAARTAGAEVTVFETADLPLLRVLGPQVARLFADLHRGHGVDLRLGVGVTEADLTGFDVVVVGVGAVPQTEVAHQAGLALDNGILVDATLRTSDPRVFAIGDVANHDHPVLRRRIRVEHWDTAIQQAKVAASNLLGGAEAYTRLPYFFTDQYDLGMEYVGSVGPEGYDRVDIEGSTEVLAGDAFRAFWVSNGTVVAAMHANDWDASTLIRDSIGTSR